MKYYKCYIESKNNKISNIDYISAETEVDAAAKYRAAHPELKNKRSLTIEEIAYKTAKKINRVTDEVIVYRIDKNPPYTKYKKLTKVSRPACSNCGEFLTDSVFCPNCNSHIIDEV